MGKGIKQVSLVADIKSEKFVNELCKVVENFQSKGYEVEVQYSSNNTYFSALVVAR